MESVLEGYFTPSDMKVIAYEKLSDEDKDLVKLLVQRCKAFHFEQSKVYAKKANICHIGVYSFMLVICILFFIFANDIQILGSSDNPLRLLLFAPLVIFAIVACIACVKMRGYLIKRQAETELSLSEVSVIKVMNCSLPQIPPIWYNKIPMRVLCFEDMDFSTLSEMYRTEETFYILSQEGYTPVIFSKACLDKSVHNISDLIICRDNMLCDYLTGGNAHEDS